MEVDFLRFFGRRNADAEGEEKDANVLVGPGSLGLRSDVSVLAISNRFGALIAGTAGGFKWAWLKELRACCVPGGEAGAAAAFHGVACGGQPLCLRLNSDETLLAVLLVSEGVHTLLVYGMVDLYHRAGAGDAAPLLSHRFAHATAGTEIQTSPTAPGQAAAVGAGAAVLLSVRTGEGSVSETKLPLPAGSVARSVGWSSDGACIYVGCGDGSVVRSSISAAVAEPFVVVLAPPADLPGHEVTLISPISDRFLLLGFDLPDKQRKEDAFTEPEVRVLDLHDGTGTGGAGALHRCAAGLFPGGREPGPADGELARRRLYCAVLPEWRLAVVCSSDSDAVSCIGSRKAGEGQRWQKWTLPDEEGPPSVPTFERGDVFEDQYVVGMGFDVGNEEQIVVVAGEQPRAALQPRLPSLLLFPPAYPSDRLPPSRRRGEVRAFSGAVGRHLARWHRGLDGAAQEGSRGRADETLCLHEASRAPASERSNGRGAAPHTARSCRGARPGASRPAAARRRVWGRYTVAFWEFRLWCARCQIWRNGRCASHPGACIRRPRSSVRRPRSDRSRFRIPRLRRLRIRRAFPCM